MWRRTDDFQCQHGPRSHCRRFLPSSLDSCPGLPSLRRNLPAACRLKRVCHQTSLDSPSRLIETCQQCTHAREVHNSRKPAGVGGDMSASAASAPPTGNRPRRLRSKTPSDPRPRKSHGQGRAGATPAPQQAMDAPSTPAPKLGAGLLGFQLMLRPTHNIQVQLS